MPGLAVLRTVSRLLPVTSSHLSAVNKKLLSNMSVEASPHIIHQLSRPHREVALVLLLYSVQTGE